MKELWVPVVNEGLWSRWCCYDLDRDRYTKFDNLKPAVKITGMFQVTQIVRFLPERGLRFRNLGFLPADMPVPVISHVGSDLQCTCTDLPGRTRLSPAIAERLWCIQVCL